MEISDIEELNSLKVWRDVFVDLCPPKQLACEANPSLIQR